MTRLTSSFPILAVGSVAIEPGAGPAAAASAPRLRAAKAAVADVNAALRTKERRVMGEFMADEPKGEEKGDSPARHPTPGPMPTQPDGDEMAGTRSRGGKAGNGRTGRTGRGSPVNGQGSRLGPCPSEDASKWGSLGPGSKPTFTPSHFESCPTRRRWWRSLAHAGERRGTGPEARMGSSPIIVGCWRSRTSRW